MHLSTPLKIQSILVPSTVSSAAGPLMHPVVFDPCSLLVASGSMWQPTAPKSTIQCVHGLHICELSYTIYIIIRILINFILPFGMYGTGQ
jgi:hypothetical protein